MSFTNEQVEWLKQLSKMIQEIVVSNYISKEQWAEIKSHIKSPVSEDADVNKCLEGIQPFLSACGEELDADPTLPGIQPKALPLNTAEVVINKMLEEDNCPSYKRGPH